MIVWLPNFGIFFHFSASSIRHERWNAYSSPKLYSAETAHVSDFKNVTLLKIGHPYLKSLMFKFSVATLMYDVEVRHIITQVPILNGQAAVGLFKFKWLIIVY